MRIHLTALLIGILLLTGCGKSDDTPTPTQQAQLDSLHNAAVHQLEVMLQRSLTDDEKTCVIVKLEDGKLRSSVVSPLSDTLKDWHRRRVATQP